MKSDKPGISSKSFYLKFDNDYWNKGDIITTGSSKCIVTKVYKRVWWRRLLLWMGFRVKLCQIKVLKFQNYNFMKEGDFVHHHPIVGPIENGRIKAFSPSGEIAWVIYHCNNDWNNYMDYTGQDTRVDSLELGWIDKDGNPIDTPKV